MGNKIKIVLLVGIALFFVKCSFDPSDNGYRKIDMRYYYRIDVTCIEPEVMLAYKKGNSFVVILEDCLEIYKVDSILYVIRVDSNTDTVFSKIVPNNEYSSEEIEPISKNYFIAITKDKKNIAITKCK